MVAVEDFICVGNILDMFWFALYENHGLPHTRYKNSDMIREMSITCMTKEGIQSIDPRKPSTWLYED